METPPDEGGVRSAREELHPPSTRSQPPPQAHAAWLAFRDAVLDHHEAPTRPTARRVARAYRRFVGAFVTNPAASNVIPLRPRP
jgi:hypothetical protein